MNDKGWIKLFSSKFLNWSWYQDTPVKCLFLHCLLKADHPDTTYKGIPVKSGQFVTSLSKLSDELGMSKQVIRTALNKLIIDNAISTQNQHKVQHDSNTIVTRNQTLITVENWGKYQSDKKTGNTKATQYQHDTQHDINTPNKNKNNKNINNNNKNKYIHPALGTAGNVYLTEEELEKLKERFPYDWQDWIDKLSEYMASKGKRYKSHYMTILTWARKDKENADFRQDKQTKRTGERHTDEDYTAGYEHLFNK